MTQLITTNNQQHVSNVTDDVGITLLHLSPNVITLCGLLHLKWCCHMKTEKAMELI